MFLLRDERSSSHCAERDFTAYGPTSGLLHGFLVTLEAILSRISRSENRQQVRVLSQPA